MFQKGTDQALDDQVLRPKPFQPEAPGFSFGQVAKAPFQGVASGSTKTAAFAAEVLGAFGTTEAATGTTSSGGMFSTQTPEERKQSEEARRKLIEGDNLFSNEAGDELRRRAKDVMPDPNSTHAAAQVVAGVAEFATQAVTYAAGAGPLAPALLGADVALAEADKLKQQGVDFPTRAKAGAVAGGSAALAVALPVAVPGSVAKTAAAVVAGGPGSFIAQNAAERAILENAGYKQIASQYDPLDPVGLALSTLVPAGFGAAAVRGARAKPAPTLHEVVLGNESNGRRFAKDGSVLTSPKGAKGEMQVMDATNLDPGFGVRPAADNSLDERARVGRDYLDAMLKRYGGDEAKAMAAYNAGPGALDNALKKGGNWLDHMPAETQAYVNKGMKKLGGERTNAAARSAIAADADTVAAARVRQTGQTIDNYRLTPDSDIAGMTRHQDAMESAHAMLARGDPVQVADILARSDVAAQAMEPGMLAPLREGPHYHVADLSAYTRRLYRETSIEDATGFFPGSMSQALDLHFANDSAYALGQGANRGVRLEFDAEGLPGQLNLGKPGARRAYDSGYAEFISRDVYPEQLSQNLRAVTVEEAQQQGPYFRRLQSSLKAEGFDAGSKSESGAITFTRAAGKSERQAQRVLAVVNGARALQDAMPPRAAPATGRQLFEAAGESAGPVKPKADAAGAALGKQAAEVADINPDLMVQLDGMDKPQRVADLLEAVKKEAAEDAQEASFVETAVNCLLRSE